jgi:drug/metabolite transporter (DMT)-like permease
MPLSTAILTAFLCLLFGANAVAIKISFEGFGVFTVASIRFAAASAIIALWAKSTGRPFFVPNYRRIHLLAYSLLFTLQLSLFYSGISRTQASRATLIVNTLPFMILILSHFFLPGDRMTMRKCAGVALGFLGVALLSLDGGALSPDFRAGDGLCAAATLIWACNTVFLKRFIADIRPFHVVFYSMLAAVPLVSLASAIVDPLPIIDPTPGALLGLVYQTLVTAVFGFIAWNTLLQRYGAASLHTFLFLLPPVGVALGGLLLNEPVNSHIVASMACIVAGIALVHIKGADALPVYPSRKHM